LSEPEKAALPRNPASGPLPPFPVVGIGASAGGIQALSQFFEKVPANSGMAYVVILHLSPDHDSRLAQVLQTVCVLPVTQVRKEVHVEPDHVYVIPPDQHLTMWDGYIEVSPNTSLEERRAPVDIFFRTLAEARGASAVCVVLSGTGANGSMGMKRVKECGGAAFVQDPREAEWQEMPRNSIATGLADDVLPVAEIPARIIAYKGQLGKIEIPEEPAKRPEDQQQALREIFTQLRLRTGHDFSSYKRATLLRRIERRINVRNLPDLIAYSRFCQANPDETQALLKDLLISVTNFFRDPKVFDYLGEEILPRLLKGKKAHDQLRIWVVGCATGEEAYSIAMLCAERMLGMTDGPKLQIFATDIDSAAIAKAREGLYTLNDAADVSAERLRRFFTKEGENYRIRRELRETILFANHNVLRDPPFSHLDIVSCRNMLIYLDYQAQERVIETLHFALNNGGYLFLGTSESMDGASDLYVQVNREHHIFQARTISGRQYPVPDSLPPLSGKNMQVPPPHESGNRGNERISYGDLHQQLLEQYAPPSLVVNEKYDVVHVTESAARYLQMSGGEPSSNLFKLIRQELRLELRTALYQATQRKTNVEARGLQAHFGDRSETINIHVRPILRESDPSQGFLLVLFEPGTQAESDEEKVFTSDEPVARQLEQELMRLKVELRTTTEQYELQAEELKASNEELQALNEELRSAAEELETSREELQSINEELTTVNQELKVKIEEVSQTSNNLQNLINSTDIATIFLDRGFRVHLFSPAARNIFNLLAGDVGRPLSDITHKLEYNQVLEDAGSVIEKLATVEREVRTTDGCNFLMRLSPYRTSDDRIQGVVATFTDITQRKQAEEAVAADLKATTLLRDLSARLVPEDDNQMLYQEIMAAAIVLMQADGGTVQVLDQETSELVILAAQGFDQNMKDRFHRVKASSKISCGTALAQNERVFMDFNVPEQDDPDGLMRLHVEAGYQSAQSTPLVARSGRPIGMVTTHWRTQHRPQDRELRFLDLLVRQAADLIEQRQADEALRKSRQDLAMELADTRKLQAVSSQLILEDNVDALYQQILDAALSLLHSGMGSIHVFDNEKNRLQLLTGKGLDPDAVNFLEWVPVDSASFCGMALANAERIIVTDLREPGVMSEQEDLNFYLSSGIRASQSTPLISRAGKIVGVLSTHWCEPYRPSERELRMLDVLARQAADLIERKRTEEALRESDRRKDEFLATLAHELRNPLAPIKNGLQIAHLKVPQNSPLTHTLKVMDRQLDHLVRLVDDLLDVARISSGKLELRRQRVSLRDALQRGVECVQPLIEGHRHELIIDMGADELFVEGDLDRLSQIFANLLSNAAKYTEEGGRISLGLTREGNEAVVRVTDTGVGIDAEDLNRVFDLFSQVTSSHKLTEGGLGIGLSLIRTLVQLHGGTITAESRGSKVGGNTFIVRLPLSPGNASPDPLPQPHPSRKSDASPLRILVVDDNVDAGVILAMLLEIGGYKAEVVHNGKDAVKKAGGDLPDVIFLDLGMPEMDGIETARHLRALPGGDRIFLVALTGWGQEKDRQRTREAGFNTHLVKPVDNAALAEVLERAYR
jgi:two-component system CheB/CheR fusion protein